MIDLTLNAFLHPDLVGLKPLFGTVIERTAENKGGLSTAQTDNNIAMALSLMRPVQVAASDETSIVEFDAKILLTGNNPLTITLANAAYNGCHVVIMNACEPGEGDSPDAVAASVTSGNINGLEQGVVSLPVNGVLTLTYFKGGWFAQAVEQSQQKTYQKEITAPKVWGAVWN